MTYQIGFIVEQALGHITHSQNLMRYVNLDPSIRAFWGLPVYETHGLGSRLPLYRSNWTIRAGIQARQALSKMRQQADLDVLFFHTQVTATLAQDWLDRFPGVVSLDATPLQYDSLGDSYAHQPGPEWLEQGKWRLNRSCFRKARRIVAWSQWAREGLEEGYGVPREKISIISPGVDLDQWQPPKGKHNPKTVRILFVGGDLERKGGKTLLEAFHRLRRDLLAAPSGTASAVELHLITRTPHQPEEGVFVYNHLLPNSAELKALFFASDLFCLPTLGDCLPLALAEAGAAGLPMVSTAVGAIGEIVRDGETGFLVPTREPEALKAALLRLVCDENLRCKMGEAAAAFVRREHNAAANAARLLSLLKTVSDQHHVQRQNT